MNTFIIGKLGEVLAFARIGSDTMKKGEKGFSEMLSKETIQGIITECDVLAGKVTAFALQEDCNDDVEKGAKKTEKKVAGMRDEYIDGHWDEASEVLEWTGFYTGAALVHWQLIMGAAETMPRPDLSAIAKEAIHFYAGFISQDEKKLRSIGKGGSEKAG